MNSHPASFLLSGYWAVVSLSSGEEIYEELSGALLERKDQMFAKYQCLIIQDSMVRLCRTPFLLHSVPGMTHTSHFQKVDPTAEMVMLERMFLEAERARLKEERRLAQEDPEHFVPTPVLPREERPPTPEQPSTQEAPDDSIIVLDDSDSPPADQEEDDDGPPSPKRPRTDDGSDEEPFKSYASKQEEDEAAVAGLLSSGPIDDEPYMDFGDMLSQDASNSQDVDVELLQRARSIDYDAINKEAARHTQPPEADDDEDLFGGDQLLGEDEAEMRCAINSILSLEQLGHSPVTDDPCCLSYDDSSQQFTPHDQDDLEAAVKSIL